MAVRIDVVPSTGFPGMPFNGQRACFLLKNMTTFDQTVKELHTRGKTKVENFNFYVSKKMSVYAHTYLYLNNCHFEVNLLGNNRWFSLI